MACLDPLVIGVSHWSVIGVRPGLVLQQDFGRVALAALSSSAGGGGVRASEGIRTASSISAGSTPGGDAALLDKPAVAPVAQQWHPCGVLTLDNLRLTPPGAKYVSPPRLIQSGDLCAGEDAALSFYLPVGRSGNSICESRYRSFFQTGHSCPPESTCQTCGTSICLRASWNDLLIFISPSRRRRRPTAAAASLGRAAGSAISSSGRLGVGGRGEAADPGERLQVLQAEVQRLAAAHRQARQRRCSRSACTE